MIIIVKHQLLLILLIMVNNGYWVKLPFGIDARYASNGSFFLILSLTYSLGGPLSANIQNTAHLKGLA